MVGEIVGGKYKIIRELGQGGMGIVFHAKNINDQYDCAIKFCNSLDESELRRFDREVRIMATISHKNVMPIWEANLLHSPPYFVMPLAAHKISDEVRQGLDINQALAIFMDVCNGIQAIHNSNATHRDIKPDNIIRMFDGTVVVSDMGLAKFENRDTTVLTRSHMFLGTQLYCAPEQMTLGGSRDADARTDVYQLGKVLYNLITGYPPSVLDYSIFPPALGYIIECATRQHPNQRYQSVAVLMDAVSNYIRSLQPNYSPINLYEMALEEAVFNLNNGHYTSDNIANILDVLMHFTNDKDDYIQKVEKIPSELLGVMSSALPAKLFPAIVIYKDAIEELISNYGFSYAENVAYRMKSIFINSIDNQLKILAMQVALIASVSLNRYAAMEIFDSMLLSITDVQDANLTAYMLRDNMRYYSVVADRLERKKLNPFIQPVYDEAVSNS